MTLFFIALVFIVAVLVAVANAATPAVKVPKQIPATSVQPSFTLLDRFFKRYPMSFFVTPMTPRRNGGAYCRVKYKGKLYGLFYDHSGHPGSIVTYTNHNLDNYSVMTPRNKMFAVLTEFMQEADKEEIVALLAEKREYESALSKFFLLPENAGRARSEVIQAFDAVRRAESLLLPTSCSF